MDAEGIRLQKVLARAGVASRRVAEEMIRRGRVAVNGRVVTTLGSKVVPGRDFVTVDGKPLAEPEQLVYLALHKPAGYVSTVRDTHGRPTVLDLVPRGRRLYPVGRLDADTEGLLLLTNDGDFAYRVTHPKHTLDKEYRVLVAGRPGPDALDKLRTGIELDGRITAPAEVDVVARLPQATCLRLVLHEGRKRQVRRMCEAVGHPVLRLQRVRIGPIALGELPPGSYRSLTPAEVRQIMGE